MATPLEEFGQEILLVPPRPKPVSEVISQRGSSLEEDSPVSLQACLGSRSGIEVSRAPGLGHSKAPFAPES
ncbi:uncharacterized protein ColSpa_09720 [Colletotrichum spaethianum]|uniref:Uncharacterized protein n=1 Tax=Colletotrichum spaethianum TaxID=700344 RepID=A0AA37PC85_9PEZI|nr:uncharacterized protein ColSpa_09720 [Colletotrichum spaethianum]GKT49539.1 hypothetical protein ColSpa_09720 [Colletotrichum spaethianum]